jgi:peptidoglycan/LPS O-acetylase OafA/YrhL
MKYNPELDSLRALAAIAVIAAHYTLFPCGWIGVQFFFVLSGFLISSIILKGKENYIKGTGLDFFLKFYSRRILRLFPLYFGYLAILAAIYLVFKKPLSFGQEWPSLFTYTLNFRWLFKDYIFHPFYGHLWSLCVEWQFYLLWPFFIWFLPRKYLLNILLWLIPLAMLIRVAECWICMHISGSISFHGSPEDRVLASYVLPFSHVDAFVFGAILYNEKIRLFLAKPIVLLICLCSCLIAGAILLVIYLPTGNYYTLPSLGWPNKMPFGYQWVWGYSLLNLTSASVIAAVMERSSSWLAFTRSRILQYLGKISYGIYVFHLMIVSTILGVMQKIKPFPGERLLGLLVAIVTTCVIAHISYKYWEQRFLKLKAKVKMPAPNTN